jgi:ribosomal protein L20A (L18A)
MRPSLKNNKQKRAQVQVLEHLPSKHKAQRSNCSIAKTLQNVTEISETGLHIIPLFQIRKKKMSKGKGTPPFFSRCSLMHSFFEGSDYIRWYLRQKGCSSEQTTGRFTSWSPPQTDDK